MTIRKQESWAIAKITARCALYMGALKSFENLWVRRRLLFPKFLMGFCSDRSYECTYKIWSSMSSKVINVGANRKRVRDCLLVRNSNLGPLLHRFGDFAAFMCCWPHPYSTLIWGVFPLHQIAHVGVSKRIGLKLFGHEIIFEVFQTVWKTYLNVTDRRTDDMQSHNRAMRSIAR